MSATLDLQIEEAPNRSPGLGDTVEWREDGMLCRGEIVDLVGDGQFGINQELPWVRYVVMDRAAFVLGTPQDAPAPESPAETAIAPRPAAVVAEVMMTAEEARATVTEINRCVDGARALLVALYDREGWKALGYSSWRGCVVAEFGQSASYLYRQLWCSS